MKIIIKSILNIFDFFTQQKILQKFHQIFKDKNVDTLFDVGSHKGEYISSMIKTFNINKIYGFEPNPNIFKILKRKINRKNIFLYNFGISNMIGKAKFNVNLESSSSSFNKLNEESKYYKKKYLILNTFKLRKNSTEIEVDITRLDKFINENKINKIDLIKIDTEGYELNILKSLGDKIKNIKVIHFEHHFDDMIIKNYNLTDIHNFLIKKNFVKIFKVKMKFRKSFEYIYMKKNTH